MLRWCLGIGDWSASLMMRSRCSFGLQQLIKNCARGGRGDLTCHEKRESVTTRQAMGLVVDGTRQRGKSILRWLGRLIAV